MTMYEGRAGALVMASAATALAFVAAFQVQAPWMPLSITIVAALFTVIVPSILGIAGVLIPVQSTLRRSPAFVVAMVVIVANCLLVALVLALLPDDLSGQMDHRALIAFGALAAAIWLACDRFYRKTPDA